MMGLLKLELRCPHAVNGVGVDPQPDWSLDDLLSEISSIEENLNKSSVFPLPFTKIKSRELSSTNSHGSAFVMRVDDMEDIEEDSEEEGHDSHLVAATRFTCDDFDDSFSDDYDSEHELPSATQLQLMEKVGLVEGALSELTHEHQNSVTEVIRSQVSALETDLINEKKKFNSALLQVEKYVDTRREMDRRIDIQYQRKIAEALDNHLTAVQRDHEHKSQIEARKIKDDAAIEEAKRRDKAAALEEKLRQERIRAEAAARSEAERKRAEEAKAAKVEAEKKAAKEAVEKLASEKAIADKSKQSGSDRKAQREGNLVEGAESALKLEMRRKQIYKEIVDKNAALANTNQPNPGSKIQRLIKTTSGTKENVRNKAQQLNQIFSDPSCPQSISIPTFVEKVVDLSTNSHYPVFAHAHVLVLISSQVPLVMDLVLAKLNKVCIYTVPKYISDAKSAFDSREAFNKAVGYIEDDDGKIESEDSYISRIKSYMKLYGAIVQTEIQGVRNPHGPEEGWAWLARFLNALPANRYTAVALYAFLEVAGFGLHRRYKSQFKKLLKIILRDFLNKLKERSGNQKPSGGAITSIQTYIESNRFLEEPEGWSFPDSSDSKNMAPEPEYQRPQQSYNRPSNYTYYRR